MSRWVVLLLLLVVPGMGRADDALPGVLALEKVMQKAIRDAEPAIACILVSRSDGYQRLGQGPAPESPGKLGTYDPAALAFPPSMVREERDVWKKKLDLADATNVPESFGSGVVVDAKGLVLTNYHVVQGATRIYVRLPGQRGSYANIHAADPRSDLAVLRLLTPPANLKALPLGDGGKAERGQFILTLANPFAAGFRDGQPSASWGIVSNLRRRAPGPPREDDRPKTLHHYGTLIQTDARLHLGCSGGALLNLHGELIGLTTALAALHGGETPGGYAVPLDAGMKRIIEVLKRGEEVEYGFLGVVLRERAGAADGVVLRSVSTGSPAKRDAQLDGGDAILAVNGTPVREPDDLFLAVGMELAGAKVKLDVRRADGKRETVAVTLAKFYVPGVKIASSPGKRPWVRGLRVDDASLLVQQPPRRDEIPPGVVVAGVEPNSPAAKAKFRPGEIITHVNGVAVLTPAAFYREVLDRNGPFEFTLYSLTPGEPAPKVTVP